MRNPKIIYVLILFTTILFSENLPLSAKQIQGKLSNLNGASAECVMHYFYTSTGWTQIEGEVGRNGIDGLYYKKKKGIVKEVLVAESKWNKSKLGKSGKNKLIKQMSQEWVLNTLQRLQKYKPLPEYSSIVKLVQKGQYRARLFRMYPRKQNQIQIQIYKIKNKGISSFDLRIENTLPPISMTKHKNKFELKVIEAYNRCRTKYLHRYFPILSDKNVELLLNDNYLQTKDLMYIQTD